MTGFLSKLKNLHAFQWLATVTSTAGSLVGIAWTICQWGLTEALWGLLPLALNLVCLCGTVTALVLTAWLGRKWGLINALYGVASLFHVLACAALSVLALAVMSWTVQACGMASTLWTTTCLIVLVVLLPKGIERFRALCHLEGGGKTTGK